MPLTLTSLGSSSALPGRNNYFTAHVLNVRGRLFLIDCGEATQFRLRQLGISIGAIEHIFITHAHGDHVFGLFGLLSSMNMLNRTKPLHIFAPAPVGDILRFFLDTFNNHGCSYEICYHLVSGTEPQVICQTDKAIVTSLPLQHGVPTYGYLFEETKIRKSIPRRVAYCTDTCYVPSLPTWIAGVDLLFHETTFMKDKTDSAEKYQHSTTLDAARVALEAGVKQLVVGHFSSRYDDVTLFLEEARSLFPATALSLEGTIFEVPRVSCTQE